MGEQIDEICLNLITKIEPFEMDNEKNENKCYNKYEYKHSSCHSIDLKIIMEKKISEIIDSQNSQFHEILENEKKRLEIQFTNERKNLEIQFTNERKNLEIQIANENSISKSLDARVSL
jgi:hypothetical protein